MEKSSIFTKTVFKRITRVDNKVILEGKDNNMLIYRDKDRYVCKGKVITVDYKPCLEILPFVDLMRLVEGYIICMANSIRMEENVDTFSKYDMGLIKEFASSELIYWNDVYKNNSTKRILYKQNFNQYCFDIKDAKINIGTDGLSVIFDNKRNRLENAQYLMTSVLNVTALISRCLFNLKKEQDVKAIFKSVNPSMINEYSEVIKNADSLSDVDKILFAPATIKSINDVARNSDMAFKKHIIDRAFDFDSKAVKLKNRGWVELK